MYTRHRLMAITASALLLAGTAASTSAAASSPAPSTSLVVNARIAGHCSFDRVVIDVKGKLPPTTVTRVKELRYDSSGKKVLLAGKHFLEIKLSPAAAHNNAGSNVYKGPRLIKLNLPKLKGFALTGDFEGVVTFGAAFNSKPSYTTKQLHRPERFVLDIAHHNTCRSPH
ncbi:AMIN-like domain-containing (lipo)protein [Streptomyces sp. SLBN-8D4]|uniref:AMIN-like domain-containing (lipo)protein n=1 Tax=Streptomyces sp. SLBN-8D4 TaxID=3377728 RepID=UPI003C7D3B87